MFKEISLKQRADGSYLHKEGLFEQIIQSHNIETFLNTRCAWKFDNDCSLAYRLREIGKRDDNWDGLYEYPAPNKESLQKAYDFLMKVPGLLRQHSKPPFRNPFVTSDEEGFIKASWYDLEGSGDLHLTFTNEAIEYLRVWGMPVRMEDGQLNIETFTKHWDWLEQNADYVSENVPDAPLNLSIVAIQKSTTPISFDISLKAEVDG